MQAQLFLDRYVRQNIAEIDEIPWRERALKVRLPPAEPNPNPNPNPHPNPHPNPNPNLIKVRLPPAERALYIELKNHLEALDMKNNHKTIKSKCKSENDREARLAAVLGGSDSPDEVTLTLTLTLTLSLTLTLTLTLALPLALPPGGISSPTTRLEVPTLHLPQHERPHLGPTHEAAQGFLRDLRRYSSRPSSQPSPSPSPRPPHPKPNPIPSPISNPDQA